MTLMALSVGLAMHSIVIHSMPFTEKVIAFRYYGTVCELFVVGKTKYVLKVMYE